MGRPDGTHALVQTWPSRFNEGLRQKFGQEALDEIRIHYCHSETNNEKPTYVGTAEALIDFLFEHPEVQQEMDILRLGATLDGPNPYGFICRYVDGHGRAGTKGFSMDPTCSYVLYTKKGW